MKTTTATILTGAALVAALTACGESSDDNVGPTVADVQAQALAHGQNLAKQNLTPAERYPQLPPSEDRPLFDYGPYQGRYPLIAPNQLQQGQDPVEAALHQIQTIVNKTADISNRVEEARQHLQKADPFLDAAEDQVKDTDGDTWNTITGGIDDLNKALDLTATGNYHDGLADAEKAANTIGIAIYRYLRDHFQPHEDDYAEKKTWCPPVDTEFTRAYC